MRSAAAACLSVLVALQGCASAPAAAGARRSGRYQKIPDVTYGETEGTRLAADVYVPEGEGPFPGVLVVHGGGWNSGTRRQMNHIARKLARRGFVAVNIEYRLAPLAVFPAQVYDCKKAVRWMRANAEKYKIDGRRIGGFGYSAGAHLVAMLAMTDPSQGLEGDATPGGPDAQLQAAVLGGTPADLRKFPKSEMVRDFLGTNFQKDPVAYERASPVRYVSGGDPPVFLYHGKKDTLVPIEQAEDLKLALEAAKVPVETRYVAWWDHIPLFLFNFGVNEGVGFLERRLAKR